MSRYLQKCGSDSCTKSYLYLPEECWEQVFRSLDNDTTSLEPLSLVSKQLLSVTNNLRSSLTVSDQTLRHIPRLFTRFPNLQSLNLSRITGDLDALLLQLSQSSLSLHSINISNDSEIIPLHGFRAFAKKMTTTLNSLAFINNRVSPANAYADLLHIIAESFPFLEQLHIHCFHLLDDHLKVEFCSASDYAVKALASALPKLRKVRFSGGHLINDSSLFHLCKNCQFLEELLISEGFLITQPGIASAIKEGPNLTLFSVRDMARQKPVSDLVASFASMRNLTCLDLSRWIISDELLFSVANAGIPLTKLELQGCVGYSYAGISCLLSKCQLIQHLNLGFAEFLEDEHITWLSVFCVSLMFINLSGCRKLTNLSLFALIRNCPLLSEIKMEQTAIGENGALDASMDFFVKPSIKSLHLSYNKRLRDESIKLFASICPNLEILVLDFFKGNGIVDVLKRCPRIRHLSLSIHSKKGLLSGMMNFQFPKLEVLKLSDSAIDDESLFVISVSCHGLLHLDVQGCPWITTKGVKQVVESCKQLKEINLISCNQVDANIVAWMVFSRSSLRRIFAPPRFSLSESRRELFLSRGCHVS